MEVGGEGDYGTGRMGGGKGVWKWGGGDYTPIYCEPNDFYLI